MKKYRIVNRNTGREIVTANVSMLVYPANFFNYVLKQVIDYVDTDGMIRIDGNSYTEDDLIVTDVNLLYEEKIRLLKDCGLSEFDAKNYIINDAVIFYSNDILGFNDFRSNMTDFEHGEIESEWGKLTRVDRINDSGYVIGSYRVDFFHRKGEIKNENI